LRISPNPNLNSFAYPFPKKLNFTDYPINLFFELVCPMVKSQMQLINTINMNFKLPIILMLLFSIGSNAQVNYTANDVVPEYNGYFRMGINPGSYNQWTDEQLADLSAGNPYLGIPGIGTRAIRPSLPEVFLDTYGYDVRLGAFQYYQDLGMEDNVCFMGYPNLQHRDTTVYCQGASIGQLFSNMYLPIWDGGANGTPYNDDNYLAAYTYEMVTLYKDYVRFWEIWNEPSLDQSNYRATLPPGHPESWWDNDPDPCDLDIQAPVYHYIRMLRVTYDVIKTVDPDAYVTLGGVGYYSFFDVLCRNTDNPVDGSVTPEYPLAGGAYFDAVGIHTYPHFDGSTIFLNNGELIYERHSDAAADGIVLAKNGRQTIMENYGYDGVTFPKKEYLITEINVPRLPFEIFMGSAESQRNFITKALVTSMSNGINQLHFYNLGDIEEEEDADSWFDVMGFYGNLEATPPYNQERNESGVAYKTAADILFTTEWDSLRSAQLNLPPDIRGGAVIDEAGDYTYILWAKTTIDSSEAASAVYNFPASLNISNLYKKEWDYCETLFEENISAQGIALNATPTFFSVNPTVLDTTDYDISDCTETVDGFNFIGQFLGHKYFRSNNALTWEEAKIFCEDRGGYLVEINGYSENDFVKNQLSDPVFIGLSDSEVEGTLTWANGEPLSFNNIDNCSFCTPNSAENDYLMLHSWDGKWSYNPSYVAKNFVMEFDCLNSTPPNNGGGGMANCDDPTAGFALLGELGGKQYFISDGANNWNDSRALAQAQGGDIIVINDEVENLFIQSRINEMVHIGLSDSQVEGTLTWVDGTAVSYENYDICSFCQSNAEGNDNLVIHPWNGGWSYATTIQNFRSIMERECDDMNGGGGGNTGNNCNVNFALNKTATQSGTQLNAEASRAVDGNTDGNFWGGNSTSLTNWVPQPYLEIDLGEVQNIEKIEVWNREDCCMDLLSNYHILVSNNPFTSNNLNTTINQTGVTDFVQTTTAARPTTQSVGISGRYIRLQLAGIAFLAVSEIKVIGCEGGGTGSGCPDLGTPCDDNDSTTLNDVEDGNCNCAGTPDTGNMGCLTTSNLALNQPTSQSSTLNAGGIEGTASKGVDGNTNGIFFTDQLSESSVAATQNAFQPWWEVNLEDNYLIENINFYNRTDGNDRTRDCYVLISNNPFTSDNLDIARAEATYEYYISGLVGLPSEIFPNVEGQYIRIQMEGSGYLLIAELEAFGCQASSTSSFAIPNLLIFNAGKTGQSSEINWTMFKDEFVEKYEVEVASTQSDFTHLGTLESLNADNSNQYQLFDRKPSEGQNFYRLKVIKKDGDFYYSTARQVNFKTNSESIFLFPNPTNHVIYLSMRDFAGQKATVEIYNSIGQKMESRNYEFFPSDPSMFDVSNYVSGIYSIVVKLENKRSVAKKFVIGQL
jgi:hypothetical protein